MTKQHEILAVEADKAGAAKRIIDETTNLFRNNHNVFVGMVKTLQMFQEGMEAVEEAAKEEKEIVTTVPERLGYQEKFISDWLDITLTKEKTNYGNAKADLVVDSEVIAKDVPATFLLNLEKSLKIVREAYIAIPTLNNSFRWMPDLTAKLKDVYVTVEPEVRTKTKKEPNFRVLYEATDKHPAQIEKWNEEVTVGKFTTLHQSGMISSARKAELLGNIDNLIQAVKQARMRANDVEVIEGKIGKALFDYIHKG